MMMLSRLAQRISRPDDGGDDHGHYIPLSQNASGEPAGRGSKPYSSSARLPCRLSTCFWLLTCGVTVLVALFYFECPPFNTITHGCAIRQWLADVPPERPTHPMRLGNPARLISAAELMARPSSLHSRLIHQSWKTDDVPDRFRAWADNWRIINGDTWDYVLWTDDDNLELVKTRFPQWLDTYQKLPKNIFRADMVRNLYMYEFGGVYADLDLEPLRPIDDCITLPNTTGTPYAAVAQMGPLWYPHSIPNAFFFASGPGHPFFLRPIQLIDQLIQENPGADPEYWTGPVALRTAWLQWDQEQRSQNGRANASHPPVELIEDGKVYPFDWRWSDLTTKCTCLAESSTFSPGRCKSLFPGAWTITYWTGSWKGAKN